MKLLSDPILDLLVKSKERPGMYFGQYDIEHVFRYMAGYQHAIKDHTELSTALFNSFIELLHKKYGTGGGGESWAMTMTTATGSPEKAVDLLYRELESFIESHT